MVPSFEVLDGEQSFPSWWAISLRPQEDRTVLMDVPPGDSS